MTEFIHYFTQIQGLGGKILMEHSFFGKRVYRCERFNVINDEEKIGLRVMGQDIYVFKKNVTLSKVYDKMFMLADNCLQLTIIVN